MIYVDSSFLVAAYVVDVHSPAVVHRLWAELHVGITPFGRSEVANTVFRQVFLKKLTPAEANRAWQSFEADCQGGTWDCMELPERAWETSVDLARKHVPRLGVRTLDTLHVACALELKAERFWTFDERQARLAEAVGLNTSA
jgi:predicted nucleic acid-binding protein